MSIKFFKVRRNAILVTIVIILLSTLFGVNRSLGSEVMEVSDLFYEGVYNSSQGYPLKSINSQLIVRAEASMNLLTVATNYKQAIDEVTKLRNARNTLLNLLDHKAGPPELYSANSDLDAAFNSLYIALTQLTLAQEDATNIDTDLSRMNGAASVIEKSEYNETVRAFNRSVLSQFPTNFLRNVCFVSEPELFE